MEITTVKLHKSTASLLKQISEIRGRRETYEQVIQELIERYLKDLNAK